MQELAFLMKWEPRKGQEGLASPFPRSLLMLAANRPRGRGGEQGDRRKLHCPRRGAAEQGGPRSTPTRASGEDRVWLCLKGPVGVGEKGKQQRCPQGFWPEDERVALLGPGGDTARRHLALLLGAESWAGGALGARLTAGRPWDSWVWPSLRKNPVNTLTPRGGRE